MKLKKIFRARIFSPVILSEVEGKGEVSVSGGRWGYPFVVLLLIAAILFSCQEEESPTGTNKIETCTTSSSEISYRSAITTSSVGSISGNKINQHGHVWGTAASPTIENSKTSLGPLTEAKSFSSNMENLEPATQYFVRSYLSTEYETIYATSSNFTTLKTGKPVVTTAEPDSITVNSVVCGGETVNDSGLVITEYGLCWDTTDVFTYSDCLGKIAIGEGLDSFNTKIDSLTDGTTYYIKAYANNEAGIGYGETKNFITVGITVPVVGTIPVSDITTNSAQSGGNVTSDGNATVTARGIVWSTSPNPTTDNNLGKTTDGTGTGSFISELTELQDGSTYYVRAYATNERGTGYGNEVEFTTTGISVPTVTTTEVSDITTNSGHSGGTVTSDGNATVTARGIVWSTSPNPTIENNTGKTTDGAGTGSFTSELTELQDGATYYVRAYATNERGTGYGDEVDFTTLEITIPEVETAEITNITATSATSGGTVTSDGNSSMTARGIVWSTSQTPTLENNQDKTTNGSGTGSFTSQLSNLQEGTTYYVRAYATNSEGTSYGNGKSFSVPYFQGKFTDLRDGNEYKWVKIGEQTWMAENLKYLPAISPPSSGSSTKPYYYVYSYQGTSVSAAKATDNYKTYGVLYNWPSALTACPSGWHLPSDNEWTELGDYVSANGYSRTEGTALKATSGWRQNGNGTDDFGFSGLPGGVRTYSGNFDAVGGHGQWWSATEYGSNNAWRRYLNYSNAKFAWGNYDKGLGFSVRCLRDD